MEKENVYLPIDFDCEKTAAQALCSLSSLSQPLYIPDIDRLISSTESRLRLTLSPSQRQALSLAFNHPFFIITGGPGTGKTLLIKALYSIYCRIFPANRILLTSPTGKACRRIEESTALKAKTLHSALQIFNEADLLQPAFALSADLIIVDEASMVSIRLAAALFSRLQPHQRVILIGDSDQLPAVGPGNFLSDAIQSGVPHIALKENHRLDSSAQTILSNLSSIKQGKSCFTYDHSFQLHPVSSAKEAAAVISQIYCNIYRKAPREDIQVLTPFRDRSYASASSLNALIRNTVNPLAPDIPDFSFPDKTFRIGDRVMQLKNTRTASNGDIGYISCNRKWRSTSFLSVMFRNGAEVVYPQDKLRSLELAYAITVHKAQGSEYDTIILPVLQGQEFMLTRSFLYTAVSRARKRVILVGQESVLQHAVNNLGCSRNSALMERIEANRQSVSPRVVLSSA